ncbi:MAG: NAD(P)H-hydrate epimerase, partial [Bacteroidota bacterium]
MLSRPDLLAPVLRADGMREADRATMEDWGLPGRTLMETAGRACADHAEALAGDRPRRAVALAGRGNNGGDGLVVARVLHARGWDVTVVTTATADRATDDTAANLTLLHRLGDDRLRLGDLSTAPTEASVVVDALLGIGVAGDLREPIAGLAAWANRQAAPVLAVDVPSGLDADTGRAAEATVRADRTVAMGALKAGLLVGDGPNVAGDVVTAEIGIPDVLLRAEAAAWSASVEWLEAILPRRAADAHKYSAGRALCVVGSRHYTGAAVLATHAAYRAGAGAVVCCTPEGARATVDAHLPEVMVDAQPEADGGALAITAYDGI